MPQYKKGNVVVNFLRTDICHQGFNDARNNTIGILALKTRRFSTQSINAKELSGTVFRFRHTIGVQEDIVPFLKGNSAGMHEGGDVRLKADRQPEIDGIDPLQLPV